MNRICRTCLRSSEELIPLFEDTKLPYKIKVISAIEVSDDDNLPKNVCAECVVNINLSYNFRRVIINSDLELRDRYEFLCRKQAETEKSVSDQNNSFVAVCEIDVVKCENVNNDIDNNQDQHKVNITENEAKITSENTEENTETSTGTWTRPGKRHRQKLYKCNKCDFQTTEYKKHKSHSQGHGVKICTICGKFITASNMAKHISTHTDPPIACHECGKICKNTESLRGHLIIHKGINRTCRICGEWYKERAAYIAHVKSHKANEDKSVRCPICDKRLYGKRGLKAHLRSHTGERPYPCEFCKKGFSSGNALKTHRRQHTNERPYKCALCPMAFPQKVSLRTHLKSKHQMGTIDNSTDNSNAGLGA